MLQKICRINGKTFTVSDKEENYCLQHNIPLPTLCPEERMRQMYSFSNAVHLYNTQCAKTKKNILTWIPPDKGFIIYDIDEWMSDRWDGFEFGQDIDWNRPFLEQVAALQKKVPAPSLIVDRTTIENSDYCNGIGGAKNCYLLFVSSNNEDCLFSFGLVNCKNVIDCIWSTDCELCYDSYHLNNCYNVRHAEQSANCSDSAFLYNCRGLKNCFGCVNLRNKEYCWFNAQLTPEEFRKQNSEFRMGSYEEVQGMKKKFEEFKQTFPIKYLLGAQNENSTGDELNSTKNCTNCFFVNNAEDVENGAQLNFAKDCIDFLGFGNNSALMYRCMGCGDNAYNLKFCLHSYSNVRDLEYCIYVGFGSSDCFGCVGLKRKQYCILNKQYSKEDYFSLVEKLREHMRKHYEYGEFFLPSASYCHYNQCEGMTYVPMSKEDALKRGFSWAEEAAEISKNVSMLPDNIEALPENIEQSILACSQTGKKYRLIKQEITAYKQYMIPAPRIAPLERVKNKLAQTKILPLLNIHCSKCQKELVSVHDTKEQLVYCDRCFEGSLS